jgi:ribosome recycling factor
MADKPTLNLTPEQASESFWVRIQLTSEQRAELAQSVGQDVEAVEIPVRHLSDQDPRLIIRSPLVGW